MGLCFVGLCCSCPNMLSSKGSSGDRGTLEGQGQSSKQIGGNPKEESG